jgi:hypothetical protein
MVTTETVKQVRVLGAIRSPELTEVIHLGSCHFRVARFGCRANTSWPSGQRATRTLSWPPTVWCGLLCQERAADLPAALGRSALEDGQGLECGTQRCSPSQDHCGIGKPSGTSAAESW